MYISSRDNVGVEALLGKTLVSVEGAVGDGVIKFVADDGTRYAMFHIQDCCEIVVVEDICGDLADLIGSPIVQAEASSNEGYRRDRGEWPKDAPVPEYLDSWTWTFYRIATAKGLVVIRWLGQSNGYYSESVDFCVEQDIQ